MDKNFRDACVWLAKKKDHPLRIVECGTIRNPNFEDNNDGLNTYHVAQWMKDHPEEGHEFYSFEISAGAIRGCREFLAVNGGLDQFVQFGLGDADPLLEHFCLGIDLCYLDAGANIHENLAQYARAMKWLRKPGLIIIDDVYDSRNANRGLLTVAIARLDGLKVANLSGRQALISVGVDDYPLPPDSHWL